MAYPVTRTRATIQPRGVDALYAESLQHLEVGELYGFLYVPGPRPDSKAPASCEEWIVSVKDVDQKSRRVTIEGLLVNRAWDTMTLGFCSDGRWHPIDTSRKDQSLKDWYRFSYLLLPDDPPTSREVGPRPEKAVFAAYPVAGPREPVVVHEDAPAATVTEAKAEEEAEVTDLPGAADTSTDSELMKEAAQVLRDREQLSMGGRASV